ncbi:Gfo/Idh/MocA family oxidoreductase, partial [Microbacterium gubbeenense]
MTNSMHEASLLAGYDGGSPREPRPIVIIGAGGIVRDAHLPAYAKAGFPVWGIVDIARDKAQALADQYRIRHVFAAVEDAVAEAPADAVYDLALMPEHVPDALEA